MKERGGSAAPPRHLGRSDLLEEGEVPSHRSVVGQGRREQMNLSMCGAVGRKNSRKVARE